ncbi:MAG TPA: GerMN domain-containing protein [Syntrophomonadaceae bacterium]|nr:GerMN domain-containing protein [Syntrophomonadaceae bacterium]
MGKKFISMLALVVLTICLISGGCTPFEKNELKSWKDLLEINPIEEISDVDDLAGDQESEKNEAHYMAIDNTEKIMVDLYFIGADGSKLTKESRYITKQEGLARGTIGELISGPSKGENLLVFPDNTELLDINIKPEGNCIIDFSEQLSSITNEHQEKLVVYSIVNTLAQFDSVKDVQILINGNKVEKLAGYVDISRPLEPDYSI